MEKHHDTPRSPEEILAAKRKQLVDKVELMLDWKLSKKLAKALEPQLGSLTGDELDYALAYVGYLDNLGQLDGPLVGVAGEVLVENAASLKDFEEKIGQGRIKELNELLSRE